MGSDEKLFERKPKETDKAWAAFRVYRDLEHNERSLAKVARRLDRSARWIEKWSEKWNWLPPSPREEDALYCWN